jgi:tyrocidine synthetase III
VPDSLTSLQQYILFQDRYFEDVPLWNLSVEFRIKGYLDNSKMVLAIRKAVNECDVFFTCFKENNGAFVQYIDKDLDVDIAFIDFSKDSEPEVSVAEWISRKKNEQMSILGGALCQFALLCLSPKKYSIFVKFHHIIQDGSGIYQFMQKISSHYCSKGALPSISYREFLKWEVDYLKSCQYKQDKKYWESKIGISSTSVFRSYTHDETQLKPVIQRMVVPNNITSQNGEAAVYSFYYFVSLFILYIHKRYAKKNPVIGLALHNRVSHQLMRVVGLCFNMILFKLDIGEIASFSALLTYVEGQLKQDISHGAFPSRDIHLQERLKVQERFLPYDIFLSYERKDYDSLFGDSLECSVFPIPNNYDVSPLSVYVRDFHKEIGPQIYLDFNSTYFNESEADQCVTHLSELISVLSTNSNMPLSELDYMPRSERSLLEKFESPRRLPPSDLTVLDLWQEQVALFPNKKAVVFLDREYTFKEADNITDQIATYIVGHFKENKGVVAACLPRSEWMVFACLGCLKANVVFLPLTLDSPKRRTIQILKQSNCTLILTLGSSDQVDYGITSLNIDELDTQWNSSFPSVCPDDIAYICFTSGSTGKPKGVLVSHRNYLSTFYGWKSILRMAPSSLCYLQLATFSFDVFMGDLLRSIFLGGTIIISSDEERHNPIPLIDLIQKQSIFIFETTPTFAKHIFDYIDQSQKQVPSLGIVMLGAESCKLEDYRYLRELFGGSLRIINGFGTTETSISNTSYEPQLSDLPKEGPLPVGTPTSNSEIYILDDLMHRVPIGVIGDMYIGGPCVARGYLFDQPQTNERFLSNPLKSNELFYKTGDKAYWRPDGQLIWVGRVDSQVKIRGFRVELGEIEQILNKYEAINETAVILSNTDSIHNLIIAFYVSDETYSVEELELFVKNNLPGYMVPSQFYRLSNFPRNMNGKLDKAELSSLAIKRMKSKDIELNKETSQESRLRTIWERVLEVRNISVDDNLFQLGGDSLSVFKLICEIQKEWNLRVPYSRLFRYSSIRSFSNYMNQSLLSQITEIVSAPDQLMYPLSFAQERFFILQQAIPQNVQYNISNAIFIPNSINHKQIQQVVNSLLARHESLRTHFEFQGPQLVQIIHENVEIIVQKSVFPSYVDVNNIKELLDYLKQDIYPFNLAEPPLLRINLYPLNASEQVLFVDIHHIISDAQTANILLRELTLLIEKRALPETPLQMKDFAFWERAQGMVKAGGRFERFWTEYLRDVTPSSLLSDNPSSTVHFRNKSRIILEWSGAEFQNLQEKAASCDCSIHTILLAAYAKMLQKYSDESFVVIGIPVINRPHSELQNTVGVFINTLPVVIWEHMVEQQVQYIDYVKNQLSNAIDHQEYPFELIQRLITAQKGLNNQKLINTLLVFNKVIEPITILNQELEIHSVNNDVAKFDIMLTVTEKFGIIEFSFDYDKNKYSVKTIENLKQYFEENLLRLIS